MSGDGPSHQITRTVPFKQIQCHSLLRHNRLRLFLAARRRVRLGQLVRNFGRQAEGDMEPDKSHQTLDILDHIRPRRPARQVLLIPVGRTIRDHKTDDDAFEEDSSSVSGTEGDDAPNTVNITLETPRSMCVRKETTVTPAMLRQLSSGESRDYPYLWRRGCVVTQLAISSKTIYPDCVRKRRELMTTTYHSTAAKRPCKESRNGDE